MALNNPIPLIPRGSLAEQVEQEEPSRNQLTQLHLEKQPSNKAVVVVALCY